MDPESVALHNRQLKAFRESQARNRDIREGIAWWADLTEAERVKWCNRAQSLTPADAWEAFKASQRG